MIDLLLLMWDVGGMCYCIVYRDESRQIGLFLTQIDRHHLKDYFYFIRLLVCIFYLFHSQHEGFVVDLIVRIVSDKRYNHDKG